MLRNSKLSAYNESNACLFSFWKSANKIHRQFGYPPSARRILNINSWLDFVLLAPAAQLQIYKLTFIFF